SPSKSRTTAVFGTLENQILREHHLTDPQILSKNKQQLRHVMIFTPSRWSAEGFYGAGFSDTQVAIVPHGVDLDTFHPSARPRDDVRRKLGLQDNDFVFLSVGAMTSNKGIDLLLKAFAEVSKRFRHARLVLKGIDPLYQSRDLLLRAFERVSGRERRFIL